MAENPKPTLKRYRALIVIILILAVAGGGYALWRSAQRPATGGQTIPIQSGASSTTGGPSTMQEAEFIAEVLLSEGQAQPATAEPVPVATGEPLSPEEIQAILARLPALTAEPQDQSEFNPPQQPIPPPRTGETISEAFPPPAQPPVQPGEDQPGPLEVARYAPEGEIPLAPFINITFNQPMVPLATLDDLSIEEVPVQVDPALPGTWRWLGTKTLTFQYDSDLIDRLPKATQYRVRVPAGTQSSVGGVLEEAVEWTFTTPPPQVVADYPTSGPQPRDPIFFVAFDQRIQPQAVLETIRVQAADQPVALELLDQDQVQEDKEISRMIKHAQEGRWLAFRARETLPADTSISVTVGPGVPSAEGPLVSQAAHSFGFRTYAPLKIVGHYCQQSPNDCQPLSPFRIQFNNPIDVDSYDESMLTVDPELPGVSVNIYGDMIHIRGASQAQTTYTVVVDGDLQDVFGQTLGRDESLTFRVGPADPILFGPNKILVSLDPASDRPVFSVYALNYTRLNLEVYAVQPSDWPAYLTYLEQFNRTDNPGPPPGRRVEDTTLRLETPADKLSEVPIDMSGYMDGDFGHFIVKVQPPTGFLGTNRERYYQTVHAWVQVTHIGVDAFSDHSEMVVWTTALEDGAPLSGVTIQPGPGGGEILTDEQGVARFPIPSTQYILARQGADQALLPSSFQYWTTGSWSARPVHDELRWYVFDDRQMYRPGEEVHVKGWLRRVGGKQDGDVGLLGSDVGRVDYRIQGPQGNELGGGRVEVNALGGFDFSFTLPESVNLGYAQLILNASGELANVEGLQYYHSFQIQEFRRPEFEVSARNETPGPFFAGGSATVAVQASYYAGGPLPNAEVTWQVSSSPGSYSPPNWPDFTFGIWQPWWWGYSPMIEGGFFPGESGSTFETFSGLTDAAGEHYLRLDFDQSGMPRPVSIHAEATVMDVNRQAWTGATNLLVHPAELYVGLRSDRYFVERGDPLEIDLIVTDLDGQPVSDRPIDVRASRMEWKYQDGSWGYVEVDTQECQVGSDSEPVSCTFETPVGGRYQITAQVTDSQGRDNQSQITRWVSGAERPPSREVEQENLELIPDKESYQPGDTAQVLVQAPFSPAEGLMTVSRSGIMYTQRFRIDSGSATLEVPILEAHMPNLVVQVDLVGAAPRVDDQGQPVEGAPPRPAYASGTLNLSIPPTQRILDLQVTPQDKELEPGGETTLDLLLEDANGQPVEGAELAVVVVDEAILALTDYQASDPMQVFYRDRPSLVDSVYFRASIVLADPLALAEDVEQAVDQVMEEAVMEGELAAPMQATRGAVAEAPAMADKAAGQEPQPIRVRTDFNPLATFAPQVRTAADGTAQVQVSLPDNLTRYRVMVVAVDPSGRQFGLGESNLTARLPLMVRPSAPRFLNFGDRFELPVVLQNQTDETMSVQVALQASNIELTGDTGVRLDVPARDRVEVRFPAQTVMAGTARFQIAAVSGGYTDAATVELPVYTPATSEAFATYGVIDQGAIVQPVSAPGDVYPQFGGLEISTSSTALQSLTDAVLYLVSYPYECTEQIASRILAVASLRDVLSAFQAEGLPAPEEIEAAVVRDIEELEGLQNGDGGFPYWRRGFDSIPFNTIHAAYALQRAEEMGFEVSENAWDSALNYLQDIESHYPAWYSQETRWVLSSYALYVRQQMGDSDPDKALRLLDEAGLENLSLDAVGWLWRVIQDAPEAGGELEAIRRHVNNRAVETPGAANFTTHYHDQTYLLLSSDRRTDAILLEALIVDDPQSDLIPKVVTGLLAHREKGRWHNTQENVFVLLALERYFKTFEAQTPDFVASIWLGETYAGGHQFSGRTTERHETQIPMNYLVNQDAPGGQQDLILSKDGDGRLYYRLGLRYAPTDLDLEPLDMGFVVQRRYEAVDDPEDVTQDEDGVWHIKAGARVRVQIKMVADNRRYHVALADPLPAGLEIVNPGLAVSGSAPQSPDSPDYRYGWWWWGTWYEHQNLRDERAEAFTSLLWDGVYDYSYVARATTPGEFVVPPAKAEEMYSPEVFGRSGTDRVIVE